MNSYSTIAFFFDGQNAEGQSVALKLLSSEFAAGSVASELHRGAPFDDVTGVEHLKIEVTDSQRFATVFWPDGSCAELDDVAFIRVLRLSHEATWSAGRQTNRRLASFFTHSWRGVALIFMALAVTLAFIYAFVLPAAADVGARLIPNRWAKTLESAVLKDVNSFACSESKLPQVQQKQLQTRFGQLKTRPTSAVLVPAGSAQLLIKSCPRLGPNALNIGRTTVILTDEMVELALKEFAKNDQKTADSDTKKAGVGGASPFAEDRAIAALAGVLGHELGHLQQDHVMRGLIFKAGLGALMATVFGDVSALVAAGPALILNGHFSRSFEREADDAALQHLQALSWSAKPMGELFRVFALIDGGFSQKLGWIATHPSSEDRATRFEAAP